ncbi:hypothetical protein H310_01181 [Aphanomyces invadans]|uniref:Poly(A) RNA polymerase mitochondrial-like central palm domain-containing protein n=1 Tax=Aphanomyces invadans TaxID=157072 RepID=A0A024UQC3_9STRA|nr:hypothetical protein H310_01181 [Aphanomyces invadans]ETW08646.1 hypothetical protein H310_01181 [Aphanomyces invadans]|eukprot:XP_008862451.1 hypothetical protein H310_01181 [Aphanomyces invadans]
MAAPFSPTMLGTMSPDRNVEAANRAYWTQWAIDAAEQERARRLRQLAEIQLEEDMERTRRQAWARAAIEMEQHSRTTRMFLEAMQNTAWFQATISPSILNYEVVCPHSWFGCTFSCMLRHIEDHLLDCPYRQVPDTPAVEDMDLSTYDVVCPNAVLGCSTICSRETIGAHLSVCGIRSAETELEERMQSQLNVIAASETERIRRINEAKMLESMSSEVHKLHDAQTKELQARLHAEVSAFGAAHHTSAQLRRPMILRVLQVVSTIVQAEWPQASVEPYGSFATHLNLPSSDVDLVVGPFRVSVGDAAGPFGDVQQLGDLLVSWTATNPSLDVAFSSIQILPHAAIPLLKVVATVGDGLTVALDVTFWGVSHQGLASAALGLELCRVIPGLKEVTLVLKYYLAKRGMNDVYRGGLSSYGLLLMVAHVCLRQPLSGNSSASPPHKAAVQLDNVAMTLAESQRAKGVQVASDLTAHVKAEATAPCLGKLMMGVLHYFANDFQPEVDAVTVGALPSSVSGELRPPGTTLCVFDPLDPTNNVGRHCYRISHILRSFQDVSNSLTSLIVRLRRGNDVGGGSLLDRMFDL